MDPTSGYSAKMEFLSNTVQKQAENSQRQIEIRLAGEQLRLRLHNAKLIKERFKQSSTFPNSFVASEVVDWLIEVKEASDREIAVHIMQKLLETNVIHHVCDDSKSFEDAKLFYRFRNDDGTRSPTNQIRMSVRCKRIYEAMVNQENSILKVREEGLRQYRRTFLGSQLVDWLIKHGEVRNRPDGEQMCKTMLEFGIIRHITGLYNFSDSDQLFQFTINFRRRRKLTEVLGDSSSLAATRQDSPDSPFCLRKLSAELPHGSFVCANNPNPPPSTPSKISSFGATYNYRSTRTPAKGLPSVLKKPVTVEELLAPGAPYIWKTLQIVGDDVGWGFVARGNGPCYVQAMDPGGPAAIAGMKIRQFIKTVNGINCLNLPYLTIYKHIVAGPRTLIMEVLEPID